MSYIDAQWYNRQAIDITVPIDTTDTQWAHNRHTMGTQQTRNRQYRCTIDTHNRSTIDTTEAQ